MKGKKSPKTSYRCLRWRTQVSMKGKLFLLPDTHVIFIRATNKGDNS
jgi:hypothetical protein